jgi:hypothetical protein
MRTVRPPCAGAPDRLTASEARANLTAPPMRSLFASALIMACLSACGGDSSGGGPADGPAGDSRRPEDDGGADGRADGTTGGPEICDGLDNDLDGLTDEDFDLLHDVAHCGSCAPCVDHAFTAEGCAAGECVVAGCDPGHMDRNGRADDGCEFSCDGAVCEICDGVDNDCDADVDEGCAPTSGCTWGGLAGSDGAGGVSNSGNAGRPSVASDSRGAIYLAWAAGSPGNSQIHVFRYDDVGACGPTTWQRVGPGAVSSGPGGHTQPVVVVGGDDQPVVAWLQDVGGASVYARRFDGASWGAMGVSDTGWGVSTACAFGYSGATALDAAVDPTTGEPIVAWSEDLGTNSDVFVRAFDGGSWAELGMDSAGGSSCLPAIPKGVSDDATPSLTPSVSVASDGTPYVAWLNESVDTFGNPLENVYVKRFNGAAWEGVAGSASAAGVSGDPLSPLGDVRSLYPDLTMVDDRPLVAWLSFPPVNAPTLGFDSYVRAFDGTAWTALPAGSDWLNGVSDLGGNIGGLLAVATRPGGRPVIAYNGFDEEATSPGAQSGVFARMFTGASWRLVGESQTGGAPMAGATATDAAVVVDVWDRTVVAYLDGGDVLVRRCADAAPVLAVVDQLDGAGEPLAVGTTATGGTITFQASLEDANGDDVRLAVEVRPVADALSGRPTHVSPPVSGGSVVMFVGSLGAGAYHWRARAVDAAGFESPWFSFGGNAEGQPDFVVGGTAPAWRPLAGSASGAGISGGGSNAFSRVAIDASGHPIVVWQHQDGGNPPLSGLSIHARRWDGSAWVEMAGSATGAGLSGAGWSTRPSIVVDGSGAPVVAWSFLGLTCGDPTQSPQNVYAKRWTGTAWVEIGAGSASGTGISGDASCGTFTNKNGSASLALLDTGEPFVAWQHNPDDGDIWVKRFDGTAWVEMGTGSASGTGISGSPSGSQTGQPDAFADPVQGTPFVTWVEESPSAMGQGGEEAHQVYVKKFNGSAWAPVAAGSASGEGIDANDGLSTSPSGGAGTGGATQHVWIAFADTTSGSYETYVLRSSGGAAFAGVGPAGGNVSANAATSYWPALAVSADGTEAVVVWSDAGGGVRDIWARRWTGSAWVEVGAGSFGADDEIGSSGVSGGAAPSGWPAVVLDAAGAPVLTWTDSARNDQGSIFVRALRAP